MCVVFFFNEDIEVDKTRFKESAQGRVRRNGENAVSETTTTKINRIPNVKSWRNETSFLMEKYYMCIINQ